MPKLIFVSLPVADLQASIAFYRALGFDQTPRFSDADSACMPWSESIHVMLLSHAKWRSFTQRPFPPAGTSASMLSLSMDSRAAVDAMNDAAAAHGGQADVNPPEDHGFMYSRDLADPDGHTWAVFWMDPEAIPAAAPGRRSPEVAIVGPSPALARAPLSVQDTAGHSDRNDVCRSTARAAVRAAIVPSTKPWSGSAIVRRFPCP